MLYSNSIAHLGMLLLVIFVLMTLMAGSEATDPVLTPQTLSDAYGDSATNTSEMTFGPLPAGEAYKTTDISIGDQGGLKPIYAFAGSFLFTAQPASLLDMSAIIRKLVDGDMSGAISDLTNEISKFIGLGICIALGILYVLIVPIVGLCFCCCRTCCGNCGGDLKYKQGDSDSKMWCFIHMAAVSILALFTGVGACLVYAASDQLTSSVGTIENTVRDNLDDLDLFLNNTVQEIKHVANIHFNFTSDVIIRDLDNLDVIIGIPVRDELITNGGIATAINNIKALDSDIQTVGPLVVNLDTAISDIKVSVSSLSSNLSDVATLISDAKAEGADCNGCSNIDQTQLNTDYDPNSMPDISSEISTMQDVLNENLTTMADEGNQKVTDIPETVKNETTSVVSNIKTLLNDFTTTINGVIGPVEELPDDVTPHLDDIKDKLNDVSDAVKDYNSYREYVGIVLATIILLMAFLQGVGVILGCIGFRKDAAPTERSAISNAGGLFLMASTGIIFIFSWLFMLLTVVFFLVGAPVERYLCDPLTDPQQTFIKEFLDGPDGLIVDNGYTLGELLLNNKTINLTLSGVLNDCEDNEGAVNALMLDKKFDLTAIVNYNDSIDINSQLDSINVDMNQVKILSADTEKQMVDFRDSLDIDFNSFQTELTKNTTAVDLNDFKDAVDIAAAASSNTAKSKLESASTLLGTIINGSYAEVNTAQADMLVSVNSLENATTPIPARVNSTIDAAKTVDNYLGSTGDTLVTNAAKDFANREIQVIDAFASNTQNALFNEIGKCRPVYNLWYSMVDVSLCAHFIDPLNGFWFSMGWCIFFMTISLVFNVKLAKYYRKLRSDGPSRLHSGKVAPADA